MTAFRSLPVLLLTLVPSLPAVCAEDDPTAAFDEKIDSLIRDHSYHAASNQHAVVKTDDPRLDVDAVAALLESFHGYFEGFWSKLMTLHEAPDRSRIYLFYSRYKYHQLLEGLPPGIMEIVGHYTAYHDVVALHTDSVGLENLADLLLHEATHRLVQVRLYGNDYQPSPWVSEGIASYFGYTLRDRSGEFKTGQIGGKGTTFFDGVSPTSRGPASHSLGEYRRAVKKGLATPLEEILEADGDSFYAAQGSEERYAATWLLIHFLLHADEGAHAPSLARYLEHEAEGKQGVKLFFEDIGMTPARLNESFAAYVSSLKAR